LGNPLSVFNRKVFEIAGADVREIVDRPRPIGILYELDYAVKHQRLNGNSNYRRKSGCLIKIFSALWM